MGVQKGVVLPEIKSCAEVYGYVKPTQDNRLPTMFADVPISGVSPYIYQIR
jgi:glycerol kinase